MHAKYHSNLEVNMFNINGLTFIVMGIACSGNGLKDLSASKEVGYGTDLFSYACT